MKRSKENGISLIVLVITIIVIIILAGAVILSLSTNNPISQAAKATFLSDVSNFQSELTLYETKQFADKQGAYNATLLQADETSVTYDGNVDTSKTMYDLIPTLGKATKYAGQFQVVDGKLVFQGADIKKQEWSIDSGIQVVLAGEPKVTILPPSETVVAPGTDITYTVKFTSNTALTTIDLTNKIEVVDDAGVALPTQPVIIIGTISGTQIDVTRQVDITIKTNSLTKTGYKLRIKAGSVTNADNISNIYDAISSIGFDISDIIPPENPIMSANPAVFTSGSVDVTISYSSDSVIKEYSIDGANWNNYTIPVVVTENNTTVYARGKDLAGNESGVATLTVTNIDKISPTIVYGTNGAINVQPASTTVTVSDGSGSGINTSTLQYVWDTQNVTTPSSGWATFTNGQAITKVDVGNYYLWIKASDNVGNNVVNNTNLFTIIKAGLQTTVPSGWVGVNTVADLNNVRNNPTQKYILMSDIDLNVSPYNTGNGWVQIGNSTTPFSGQFDGNGFTIKNLYINRPSENYVGFFGSVDNNGTVKNLRLENVNVTGSQVVGGLIGYKWNSFVTSCVTSGTVTGVNSVGGLIGQNGGNALEKSFANVTVNSTGSDAGGLVGWAYAGNYNDCYARGDVNGKYYVGGLFGEVSHSFAAVRTCYSTGKVTGLSNVGGLVGATASTNASSLYWNTTTSTKTTSALGTGYPTSSMKTQSTYSGFDFTNIWIMNSGEYPKLRWE